MTAAQRQQAFILWYFRVSDGRIERTYGSTRQSIIRLCRSVNCTVQTCDRPRSRMLRMQTSWEDQYVRVFHPRKRSVMLTSSASISLDRPINVNLMMRKPTDTGIRAWELLWECTLTPHEMLILKELCSWGIVVTGLKFWIVFDEHTLACFCSSITLKLWQKLIQLFSLKNKLRVYTFFWAWV